MSRFWIFDLTLSMVSSAEVCSVIVFPGEVLMKTVMADDRGDGTARCSSEPGWMS